MRLSRTPQLEQAEVLYQHLHAACITLPFIVVYIRLT